MVLGLGITLWLAGCGASLNEGMSAAQLDGPSEVGAVNGKAATPTPASSNTTLAKSAQDLTTSSRSGSTAYKIGPLDVLEVSVFKVPELSKTVQVADTGSINLPLVGEISAAGLTAQDVERDLTKKLGAKYLQNPQVNVFVKEYNSQRVTIEGAVKKPGVYPIRGKSTLLQIIATAEGITEVAQDDIVVFRETNGKRTAAKFSIAEIREGKSDDPMLQQGDTIVVGTSALAVGYQNLLKALPIGSFIALL